MQKKILKKIITGGLLSIAIGLYNIPISEAMLSQEEMSTVISCVKLNIMTPQQLADKYKKKMEEAAADLNFEVAAEYRDQLVEIKNMLRDAKVDADDRKAAGRSGRGYHKSRRTPG